MADFTGGDADDTFNAPATNATTGAAATTVNSGDAINGGAGNDTLNITATATNNNSLTGLTATSIETVNIAGANNLGAASPAYAAALDAKAVTAAALVAAQSNLADASARKNAAVAVDALTSEFAVVATSTATVASAAKAAAAQTHFASLIKTELDAYTAAVTGGNAGTIQAAAIDLATKINLLATSSTAGDFGTIPATGATFAIADVNAVAASVRTAQDGTSLTVPILAAGASATAVNAAGAILATRNTLVGGAIAEVNKLAQSTLTTDVVADQEAAAAAHVATLSGANIVATAALTGTPLTTAFTALNTTAFNSDQLVAAAKAAAVSNSGGVVVEADQAARAAVISSAKAAVAAVNDDFSLAQLNAAAVNATRSATGASLLTAGDDTTAVTARGGVLNTDTTAAANAANTAVTAAVAADATAANAVTVALASVGATSVAASQFADATAITLSGASSKTNVTAVAATQTIGFSSVSSMENAVTFGSTVAAGSIAASGSSGALTVTGATMASLNVSGTGTGTAGIALTDGGQAVSATGADTIKALNLTTSGSTVINTTGMTALTSVTQSGAGGVTVNSTIAAGTNADKLATVTTGAGGDSVRITTVTAADNLGTSIDETVNASVSTGAGADRVLVATTGNGKTTVDTGADNDTIILSSIGTGVNSLSGGAGNDTFRIGNISTLATTTISGGDGTDVLRTTQAGTYTATDYTTLVANVSSIETLQLAGAASVTLDASKVAVNRIEFLGTGTNTVTEVSSLQALAAVRTPASALSFGIDAVASPVVVSSIVASSKGYVLDNDAGLAGNQTVFGDNLNIAMTHVANNATVLANGNALTLSVTALGAVSSVSTTAGANVTGIDSQVTLSGDVKSVAATLTSARGVGSVDAPTALGAENVAKFAITLDADGESNGTSRTLGNLETITVSGAGVVTIDTRTDLASTAAKLTTINLSGMTALSDLNALGQEQSSAGVAGGFNNLSKSTVTLDKDVVETVVLGGAQDTVVTASTYAKADTITGFQLVASAADPLVADASRSDVLKLSATAATALTAANSVKMTVTGSTLEAALLQAASATNAAGAARDNVVFNFGGDTYFFQDVGGNGLDDSDVLVKFSGNLNLDLLLTSITIA